MPTSTVAHDCGQQHVVEDQAAFPADRREQPALAQFAHAHREQGQRAADEQHHDHRE